MDYTILAVCLGAALVAGFIHGALGMGFGMIAMAAVTLFVPYNNAAAIVSVALLVLVIQVSVELRQSIDWGHILVPSCAHLVGKVLGIVLMMHLQSSLLRICLGVFLILYSGAQLLQIKALQIRGGPLAAIVTCGVGGLFGGVFNVSGPFASIYCQAKYGDDPKAYAANMNMIFVPSAIVAVGMHFWYGNYTATAAVGSLVMVLGVLAAAALGVAVLRRIRVQSLRRISYIYIILMGIVICVSG